MHLNSSQLYQINLIVNDFVCYLKRVLLLFYISYCHLIKNYFGLIFQLKNAF
jgi:hypothetical protein